MPPKRRPYVPKTKGMHIPLPAAGPVWSPRPWIGPGLASISLGMSASADPVSGHQDAINVPAGAYTATAPARSV